MWSWIGICIDYSEVRIRIRTKMSQISNASCPAGGGERGEERVYPRGGGAAGERDSHHPGGGGGPRHQGVPPQGDHSQPGPHQSSSS